MAGKDVTAEAMASMWYRKYQALKAKYEKLKKENERLKGGGDEITST